MNYFCSIEVRVYSVKTGNKSFFKELSKLMIPIAFQSFMLAAVAASDSIMLGIVNQDALSAVSLASKIQFVQNIGIAGLVGGGMVLSSQYLGKNNNAISIPNTSTQFVEIKNCNAF